MVKAFLGSISLALALAGPVVAAPTSVPLITPPQPRWGELSVPQKQILAPLAEDWDAMESYRRRKWLGIAHRYPNMTPDEQQRTQERMKEWAKLTPEQRSAARNQFQEINRLPPEKKQSVKEQWEIYANLPEEEKARLKALAAQQQAASKTKAAPKAPGTPPASPSAPATVSNSQ